MLWHKVWGEPTNPILIFLHGFMGTHRDFLPLIKILEKDYYCVALDLPGHGIAQKILPQSQADFDDIIMQTLQPYINQKYTLIGYSMGGRIALRLSSVLDACSLVLISSLTSPLSKLEKKERLKKDKQLTLELQNSPFNDFLKNWYRIPLFVTLNQSSTLYTQMIEERKKQSPRAMSYIMNLLSPANYYPSLDAIKNFKNPLLYCCGKHDKKYFAHANSITNQKKDLWKACFSKASHAVHFEKPHSLSQTIKQFQRYYYDRMETAPSI